MKHWKEKSPSLPAHRRVIEPGKGDGGDNSLAIMHLAGNEPVKRRKKHG